MFKNIFRALLIFLPIITACSPTNISGEVVKASSYSVVETADRFETILNDKGLTLFARIDHTANAKSVDMTLRPTELIVFGNPKLGTPLMQCEQLVALDLPQKLLIWEDDQGKVWVTYNSPSYLQKRHSVKGCDEVLAKITKALDRLVKAAAGN